MVATTPDSFALLSLSGYVAILFANLHQVDTTSPFLLDPRMMFVLVWHTTQAAHYTVESCDNLYHVDQVCPQLQPTHISWPPYH